MHSKENERLAKEMGVKKVCLPKAGKKSEKREEHGRQGWYKRARRFRAGIEGRISVMKRRQYLGCCWDRGVRKDSVDGWDGESLTANLDTIARTVGGSVSSKRTIDRSEWESRTTTRHLCSPFLLKLSGSGAKQPPRVRIRVATTTRNPTEATAHDSRSLRSREPLELIPELRLEMEPALAALDRLLDDDEIFLRSRPTCPGATPTPKARTPLHPVEVILRMLVLRRLYDWSFEATERNVSDSLLLRQFCRLYLEAAP